MVKPIGSINCYVTCTARYGKKIFTYDGTTKGLVNSALKAGLKTGDVFTDEFNNKMEIIENPHDERCGGFWARKVLPKGITGSELKEIFKPLPENEAKVLRDVI